MPTLIYKILHVNNFLQSHVIPVAMISCYLFNSCTYCELSCNFSAAIAIFQSSAVYKLILLIFSYYYYISYSIIAGLIQMIIAQCVLHK